MLNVRSSAMLVALTLVRMLAALGATKIVSLYHGPLGIGLLGHLQGLTGFLAGILAAPLGNGLIRAIASDNGPANETRGLVYWRSAVKTSCIIFIGALVLLGLFRQPVFQAVGQGGFPALLLALAVAAAPFQALNTGFQSLLNGLGRIKALSLIGISGTLLAFVISVAALWGTPLNAALAVLTLSVAAQTVVYAAHFRNSKWLVFQRTREFDWQQEVNGDILKFSVMAAVSALLIPGAQIFIRSFLANETSWVSVGYWQAAQRLSDAHLSLIGTILSTQLLPKLIQTEHSQVGASIVKGMLISGSMLLPGAIIMAAMSTTLIHVLFSDSLAPAAAALKYQALGDFFRALSWPCSYFLISRAKSLSFCWTEITFAAIWSIGTVFMVNDHGWSAASLAYLFASISTAIVTTVLTIIHIRHE